MPVIPDPDKNLIQGLSDFWVAFFRDTSHIQAFYEATQLALGQAYLDLLDAVLGTSLEHAPLFSKTYYKLVTVREDQLAFVEGPSTADDRWHFAPDEKLVEAATLMNKVVAPTAALEHARDYELVDAVLRFHANPLRVNTDGALEDVTLDGFPVRVVQVAFLASYVGQELDGVATHFRALGVEPGDALSFRIGSSTSFEAPIALVRGRTLYLGETREEFRTDVRKRTHRVRVYRTPHDTRQEGRRPPNQPRSYAEVAGTLANGPPRLLSTDVDTTWVDQYLYVRDAANPENDGFYRVTTATPGVEATVSRVDPFVLPGSAPTLYLVNFAAPTTPATPLFDLEHQNLVPGTVSVSGRRAEDHVVGGVLHAAGGALTEGVDYAIDYELGTLRYLSVWEPRAPARVSYDWRMVITEATYTYRGAWDVGTPYSANDVVTYNGREWIATANNTGVFPTLAAAQWREFNAPFAFDQTIDVKQTAFWAPDVLVDRDKLYNNFGYLLGRQRPTSEQYRAFLKGVAQLFLLGPTLERIESAMNVMAGFPVVRDDGEVLTAYDDGVEAAWLNSSHNGRLTDTAIGSDGALGLAGTFTSPTAGFFATDVGATIAARTLQAPIVFRDTSVNFVTAGVVPGDFLFIQLGLSTVPALFTIRAVTSKELTVDPTTPFDIVTDGLATPPVFQYSVGSSAPFYNDRLANASRPAARTAYSLPENFAFTVTAVTSPTSVQIAPTPTVNHVNVLWEYTHNALTRLFRIDGGHVFTDDDLDGEIVIESAVNARNVGSFRIAAIEGLTSVRLESPHGFIDEGALKWKLTRTRKQVVTTSRAAYDLPFRAPVREDVRDPASLNTLTFAAFDALTEAFVVEDYVRRATWWHDVTIPQELLTLVDEASGRRRVTPQLIEHTVGPLDEARVNDPGMLVGCDDEGSAGIARTGPAMWAGGPWVVLQFDADTPVARPQDTRQHAVIKAGPFKGFFKIKNVSSDGLTLELERFPPPEAAGQVSPITIDDFRLPPLIYRRTVAFVMMDRFLKYHSLRIAIDLRGALTPEFVAEAAAIVNAARPSHTFVYLDPVSSFLDELDLGDDLSIAFGPEIAELMAIIDNEFTVGSDVLVNELYAFDSQFVAGVQGVTGPFATTVVPSAVLTNPAQTIPAGYRTRFVFGRFASGTSGGKKLVEGVNYTFDYTTGALNVPTLDAGAYRFEYVVCFLRIPTIPDPRQPWETDPVVNGTDPLIRQNAGMGPGDVGLIDRAIQIRIT